MGPRSTLALTSISAPHPTFLRRVVAVCEGALRRQFVSDYQLCVPEATFLHVTHIWGLTPSWDISVWGDLGGCPEIVVSPQLLVSVPTRWLPVEREGERGRERERARLNTD